MTPEPDRATDERSAAPEERLRGGDARLPAARCARPTGPTRPRGRPGRRILLVDDRPVAAEPLSLLLEWRGHRVRVACDGEQALRGHGEFDVALLDLWLPDMSGIELARRLRARENGERATLIALTGYTSEESRRRCLEAGFDAFLVKPVLPERIEQAIQWRGRAGETDTAGAA